MVIVALSIILFNVAASAYSFFNYAFHHLIFHMQYFQSSTCHIMVHCLQYFVWLTHIGCMGSSGIPTPVMCLRIASRTSVLLRMCYKVPFPVYVQQVCLKHFRYRIGSNLTIWSIIVPSMKESFWDVCHNYIPHFFWIYCTIGELDLALVVYSVWDLPSSHPLVLIASPQFSLMNLNFQTLFLLYIFLLLH